MTKTMKKFVLAIALFIGLTFTFLGLTSINPIQAKADTNTTTYFSMDSGVQLRLASSLENETHYGMRFIASMDETTATTADSFGMLIVPAEYVTDIADGVQYASKITEKGGDYIAAYAELGTAVLNVSGITPYASGTGYKMNGVISDIKYDNLNRDFVAIAYSVVGSDYTYTAVSEPANVYDLSIKALADTKADYDVEELAVLDEYRFLAEKQVAGVEEQTAKDGVLAYTTALANIRADLTDDEILSFDVEDYSAIIGEKLTLHASVGTLTTPDYNSSEEVRIVLPNPIKVEKDTVMLFRLESPLLKSDGASNETGGKTGIAFVAGNPQAYVIRHGGGTTTSTVVSMPMIGNTDSGCLGRTEGEIIKEIYLSAWNNTQGYTNYDYISVTTMDALKKSLDVEENASEAMSFDDVKYGGLIATSANALSYAVKDGTAILSTKGENTWFTLNFTKSYTVKAGDLISLTLQVPSGKGVYIGKEGAQPKTFAVNNGTGISDPLNNKYYATGSMMSVSIPVSSLGYEVGETISAITITNWNYNDNCCDIVVDTIGYITLTDNVLVDLSEKSSLGVIQGVGAQAGKIWADAYTIAMANVSYDQTEKAACVKNVDTNGNPRAFWLRIPEITLTENTEITFSIKITAGSVKIDDLDNSYENVNLATNTDSNGEWISITVKPCDNGAASIASGTTTNYLILGLGYGGTAYFGQVTVSNAG